MENKTKSPAAKKGNKTTEIIIGASANKLTQAVSAIAGAMAEVAKLEERVQQSTLEVTNLEDKIGGLEQEYQNKKAQQEIDLKLSYESNKDQFVSSYLGAKNLETIAASELTELKRKAYQTEDAISTQVQKAVEAARSTERASSAAALKMAQLEYQTKEANNLAEIKQLTIQITFLEEQVTMWKNALDEERKAATERAKYGAINTLNVGGTPQGR